MNQSTYDDKFDGMLKEQIDGLRKQLAESQAREARLIAIMHLMEENFLCDHEGYYVLNVTKAELEAVGIQYESKCKYGYEVPLKGFVDLALTTAQVSAELREMARFCYKFAARVHLNLNADLCQCVLCSEPRGLSQATLELMRRLAAEPEGV